MDPDVAPASPRGILTELARRTRMSAWTTNSSQQDQQYGQDLFIEFGVSLVRIRLCLIVAS